jgi:hypothetical protein
MMRVTALLFVLFLSVRVAAQQDSYALIVTNNRSQTASRPDLHYADDDGVQYAQLFADLLGPERVTLLTQLDAETRALHPQIEPRAPTHANLLAAVQQIAAASARVVYLVFAGHGDLERGQGYLDLADGRLTARELDELIIARLPAERIHLVLDSCNSYFLLSPRKPGGKRWSSTDDAPRDLLSKYPRLGAILSTSAEAVTYEWSEIQSGVFSYEVRAGLRGGADANSDGTISYAELTAFIRVANQPVVNDLYRPKVYARRPKIDAGDDNAVWVRLPALTPRRLVLDAAERQRLTLRDAQGVRLLDLNKEAGTAVSLLLPEGVTLSVQERMESGERPSYIDAEIPLEGAHALDTLLRRPSALLSRGDAPIFRSLFAEPFGMQAFQRAHTAANEVAETPSGVSERDVERLRLHLSLMASSAKSARVETGLSLLLASTIPCGALTYSIFRNSEHTGDWLDRTGFASGVANTAITLGMATYFLSTPWSEERLDGEFRARDFSTERQRSRGIPEFERQLQAKVEESRRGRDIGGWVLMIGGGFNAVQGGILLGQDVVRKDSVRVAGPIALLVGLAQVGLGLYLATTPSTLENTWTAYASDPDVLQHTP